MPIKALNHDDIANKLKADELVHFYCIQLFLSKGGSIHCHAPLTGDLLNKDQLYQMAQEIMTTGRGAWGDDPHWAVAIHMKLDDLSGCLVEHKQSVTRGELAESIAKRQASKSDESKNPLESLLARMQ